MAKMIAVQRMVNAQLADLISGQNSMLSDPTGRVINAEPRSTAMVSRGLAQALQSLTPPGKRVKEMKYYDYLETNVADVRKALDAVATMACTGNLTGGGKQTFNIRQVDSEKEYPEALMNRLRRMENIFKRVAFSTVRAMCKYGTFTPAIVPGILDDGRKGVLGIKPVPPGTIFRHVENGTIDPKKFWYQSMDEDGVVKDKGGNTIFIEQWRLAHFALWTNIVTATKTLLYGTSMLQPVGAIAIKMNVMLDSMVVARLTRAAMRYVHKIDVSDLNTDREIMARVMRFRQKLGRDATLLDETTKQDSYQAVSVPDADFFLPVAKDKAWDLDTVTGDTNLSRVQDVELLTKFFFGALGVPPEYLGHDRGSGGRSTLSQIDIHFARLVRYVQMFAASGFDHIVWVDMILGGWDPREYPVETVPPPIGARDELLKAQVRVLESQVVATLAASGMDLSLDPRWILETFLNMDEELESLEEAEIEKLFKDLGMSAGTTQNQPTGRNSAEARRVIADISRTNSELMAQVRDNIRLIAFGQDALMGNLAKHDQPEVNDLVEQVS